MYNLIAGVLTLIYGMIHLLFGGYFITSLDSGVMPGIYIPVLQGLMLSATIQSGAILLLMGGFQAWCGWRKKDITGPARFMTIVFITLNFLSNFGVAHYKYPELLQVVLPQLALFMILFIAQVMALMKKQIQMA